MSLSLVTNCRWDDDNVILKVTILQDPIVISPCNCMTASHCNSSLLFMYYILRAHFFCTFLVPAASASISLEEQSLVITPLSPCNSLLLCMSMLYITIVLKGLYWIGRSAPNGTVWPTLASINLREVAALFSPSKYVLGEVTQSSD